ncbi:galactokinase gal [Gamsiella multidivaricata]|uniref:galactokinase gal n=1 Tax=Gamsiella multidivaricata TaxID=101098 RepID=UPI002220AC33|nr:galactokinase gal [Gamsiella multidivaricata]KAI7818917.1 galactokinase gal [Gamsiella multidivaricata]
MTSSTIPIINDISILYSEPKIDSARARWVELSTQFENLYGRIPDFIARSPGRVNLIGEHIDYAGFGVLPMAIEDDCLIAVAIDHSQSAVKLANLNPEYTTLEFSPKSRQDGIVPINPEAHIWSNYFLAGYRGVLEEFRVEQPKGMLCLMSGTVPTGAGLSSSSAVVCCSVIATVKAQEPLLPQDKKSPSAHELAILSIRSEGYVGAMVGGMDQACSILSKPNSALFIEFHPVLKVTPVHFPKTLPPIAFVIADTLVTSNKAVTAPVCYNLRVVETRGAARILALALGIPIPATGKLHLKQVLDAHFDKIGYESAGKTEAETDIEKLTEMTKVVERVFGTEEIKSGVSFAKMCELAGLSEQEFTRLYIQQPIRTEKFHLYRRAKHVYSEEKRVVQFRNICEKSMRQEQDVVAETLFTQLGELMDASQDSCHALFDCSCDELEELTALARRAGAYGSRLTGAGWGGATVSLVAEDKVPEFIEYLKKEFYAKHHPNLTGEKLNRAVFATAPSSGAATFVGHL